MRKRVSLVGRMRDNWRFRYTSAGRLMLIAVFVASSAGSVTVSVPIYHVFVALVFLYGICIVFGWLLKPRLDLSILVPDRVTAGAPFSVTIAARARGRLPCFDVGFALRLPPGMKEQHPVPSHAMIDCRQPRTSSAVLSGRRGRYLVPGIIPYSLFPFGLYRIPGRPSAPFSVLIVPRYGELSSCRIPSGQQYQSGGITHGPSRGESPEYYGNREYRPGDSTRHIDFRSWARLAKPVVKEFREEYFARLALVLDTSVDMHERPGPEGFAGLEAAISLAAAVADFLERGEYVLDLFAAGRDIYSFSAAAGRGIWYLDSVLEILAGVEPSPGVSLAHGVPDLIDGMEMVSGVIIILLNWDESRAAFVRQILEAGGTPEVVIVRDGPTPLPLAMLDGWGVVWRLVSARAVNRGEVDSL